VITRRSRFFVVAAVVCVALVPAADAQLRYVPTVLAIWYAILAIASQLDHRSRQQHQRR
jgi:hypothetical protein